MTPRTRAWLVTAAALLGPAAAALAVHQIGRYVVERDAIRIESEALGERVARLDAAAKHRPALERELAQIEGDLQRLTAILPPRLDADAFVAAVRSRTEPEGVSVTENEFRADPDADPPKGVLSAVLRGPEEKLVELVPRIKKWSRLVDYREVDRGAGWRLATLTTYAAPPKKSEPARTADRSGAAWLPPFPSLLTAERHRVEELQASVSGRRDLDALVHRFDDRKERLQTLVSVIVELKAKIDPEGAKAPAGTAY